MAFKDIEQLRGTDVPLTNVVLSHNPCPDCVACNGKSMTFEEWEDSEWGLPGSSGRVCEDDCHCVLVPNESLADLPAIGEKVKLRGDEDTDIRKIVDIGPNEENLKFLMDKWKELTGGRKLPPEIYKMSFKDIEKYLLKMIEKLKIGEFDAGDIS
jgi:hypothetical protein